MKPTDETQLRAWLVKYLAETLDISPTAIFGSSRFDRLGVDSTTAVALSGDLSELLDRDLAPTLLYDHPTLDDLIAALTVELDEVEA